MKNSGCDSSVGQRPQVENHCAIISFAASWCSAWRLSAGHWRVLTALIVVWIISATRELCFQTYLYTNSLGKCSCIYMSLILFLIFCSLYPVRWNVWPAYCFLCFLSYWNKFITFLSVWLWGDSSSENWCRHFKTETHSIRYISVKVITVLTRNSAWHFCAYASLKNSSQGF